MSRDAEAHRIVGDLAHDRNLDSLEEISAEELVAYVQRELAGGESEFSRADVAAALIRLGDRRAGSDRPYEAMAATKEAVELFRTLATERPGAFREEFARALERLGVRLAALWQHEPALQANREAHNVRHSAVANSEREQHQRWPYQ